MTLLYRIKEIASQKKISLAELERIAGLSSGSITKWEKSSPKAESLMKVANSLNVSTDYLLGIVDSKNDHYHSEKTLGAVDMIIDNNDPLFIELIGNLPLLDKSEMKVVNDIIKSLVALKQKKS